MQPNLKIWPGSNDPRVNILIGETVTTDATATTVASITIPANTLMQATVRYGGKNTGASGGTAGGVLDFIRYFTFKNFGGVTSQVSASPLEYPNNPHNYGTPFVAISGSTVNFQVTGRTGETIKWKTKINYDFLSI